MAKRKEVLCEGLVFDGVDLFAEHYGIHASTVGRRLRAGWTPEQAVGLIPYKRTGYGTRVDHKGMTYRTIKEACETLGLDEFVVRGRLHRGYSITDALEGNMLGRPGHSKGEVEFGGERFASLSALAQKNGQTGTNVRRRIGRGWTLEQALLLTEAPPRFRNFAGHARTHKWKEVRTTCGIIEPTPDASGYKLYVITNTANNKVYIGITIGPLQARLRQHFAAARSGRKSAFGYSGAS